MKVLTEKTAEDVAKRGALVEIPVDQAGGPGHSYFGYVIVWLTRRYPLA